MGTGNLSREAEWPMCESDRLHPRGPDVKNKWNCNYTPPPYATTACTGSNFTFYLKLLTKNRESDSLYNNNNNNNLLYAGYLYLYS